MNLKRTFAMLLIPVLATGMFAQTKGHFDAKSAPVVEKVATESVSGKINNHSLAPDPVFSKNVKPFGRLHDASKPMARRATPARVLGDGTIIYGSLIYSSNWSGTGSYGIYSFPAANYQAPTCVVPFSAYEPNGGGTYGNGKYYYNSYVYTDEMGYTFSTFCTYDFATEQWSRVTQSFLTDSFDQSQITSDMAYDPTDGTIYALAYIAVDLDEDGYIQKYYPAIATIDNETGYVSPIAQIPQMITLAINQSGEMYAISKGAEASLYRINKETGDYTLIGKTGLNTEYVQSMAFDPVKDKLYWAAVETSGASGLYEVNTSTGVADKVCDFEANEEYSGLYIPEPEVAENAPAGVSNFAAIFSNDSHNGTVELTLPSTTYGGSKLSGELSLDVTVDGAAGYSGTHQPGEKVSFAVTLDEGIHNFAATVSNTAGNSPRIGISKYVGLDAPGPVGNLSVAPNDKAEAVITWTAPTKGRNDGYIDSSKITYNIVRYPDNVTVAQGLRTTTFTDPVNAPNDNYYFAVTPYCDGREGVTTKTSTGLFGTGTTLPCKFDFSTQEQFDLFTVIDANNDFVAEYNWGSWLYGPTFKYIKEEDGNCALYGYSPESAADDWLITPSFLVEKDKKYRLTYTLWTRGDEEQMEVTAGTLNTIEAQKVITPKATYKHTDHRVMTQDFTASATGNYNIGFHVTSGIKKYYLFITDIMIDEIPDENAPSAVEGLSSVAGTAGAMEATVTFNAPSKTMAGTALTALSRIDIYRGNGTDACETFTNPAPGASLSWRDDDPDWGFNTYRVVAYANGLAGEKSETTVFVGYDLPTAPTDVKVSVAAGSKPVITWTAPTTGQNGGYINPDELVYAIYRLGDRDGLLTRNATGTSFTDNDLDGSYMQYYVGYEIIPVSDAGAGDYAVTEMIVYGDPYEGEFSESFADLSVSSNPWLMYRIKGSSNLWGLYSQGYSPYCSPVDGDGGLATFSSTSGNVGDEGRLVSPKLNLSSMNAPVLSFYVYLNESDYALYFEELCQDRLIPEVQLPDGSYVALGDAILIDNLEGYGWVKYTYDLTDYKNYEYVRLSFHGIADYEQDVNLDLIQISNRIDNDLKMYTFSGPTQVRAGKEGVYRVTYCNQGANTAVSYKINLYRNGEKVMEQNGPKIPSGEYRTFQFPIEYTTADEGKSFDLCAELEWEDDEIPGNNVSETISTKITAPALPEVYKLNATVEEMDVTLTWDKPTAYRMADSFEDYTAYSIDNIGDYTLVDGDGGYTYGFSDIYFDNSGAEQAFMVFNPVKLGIVFKSSLFPDAFDPHTGNQVLACFQAYDAETAESLQNDDWLISPLVHGGQTISLYAKAGDVLQGEDQFEVLYSTSDKSTSSFVALSEVITTDQNWTLHEFTLPENAKYFAIHCVSEDEFALYIDDLNYVENLTSSPLTHTGYRVYRNGVAIADLGPETQTYTDANLSDGDFRYKVTAIYDNSRESAPTEEQLAIVGEGGLNSVTVQAVKVRVVGGKILITAPAESPVTVMNTAGIMLYSAIDRENHEISVEPGVYMATIGKRCYKVIAR